MPSLSEDGARHEITTRRDGSLACACPAYTFSRAQPKHCTHLDIYRTAEHLVARCRELDHGAGRDAVCAQCVVDLLAVTARKVRRKFVPKPARKPRRKKGKEASA